MPLSKVIIDEQTFSEATQDRHLEWDLNIREFLNPATLVFDEEAHYLKVTMNEQRFMLEAHDTAERLLSSYVLPHRLLSEQVQEYVDVVRQISNAQSSGMQHRVDALDMAKKVTHDRTGRILKRELKRFRLNLATARRLFTLLLAIRIDTTRLTGIYGHRRVR